MRHCFALPFCICLALLAGASAPPASAGEVISPPLDRVPTLISDQVGVAPQYTTSHVYVPLNELDVFVQSFIATFGGEAGPAVTARITATPSDAVFRAVVTPVGILSVFGFKTPVPYPFGRERTGYLVRDMPTAIATARMDGAAVLVAPFADAIGRDAVIQWPGGVDMQLYWHFAAPPKRPPLKTVPENRIYLPPEALHAFLKGFIPFAHGRVVSDELNAPGIEIGEPRETYRRLRIACAFGRLTLLVTDGHLPYPYGYETTGYEVEDLATTLVKAKANGAKLLAGPYMAEGREAAMVEFPGGYIAEIHSGRRS